MKKVVWPTRQQVTKNTGVVLSVMVVMALFLSALIQVWVQLSRLSLNRRLSRHSGFDNINMEVRNMSEEAKWYVVHTYSGYENKVKAILKRLLKTETFRI